MRINFILLFFLLGFIACRQAEKQPPYYFEQSAISENGMVVSAHPLASQVGRDILQQGGNAVDAAIAVQFALAVVYPRAGNLGGGGFMVFRTPEGEVASIDYREKAPLAAHHDMYLDSLGNPIKNASMKGHLAVGVPGTVAGLWKAYQRYSALRDWSKLLKPSIELAEDGFSVTQSEADRLNRFKEDFIAVNGNDFPFVKEYPWEEGDMLTQKALASSLKLIAAKGADAFYKGPIADQIAKDMEKGGGMITKEDLAQYEAKWRQPILGDYKNFRIISMPPPSSGGVALVQLLELVEPYPIQEWGFRDSATVHLIIEAERRVYADRAMHLGDKDFYPVPVESLLDAAYLEERMEDFQAQKASVSDSIESGQTSIIKESFETTHTSIIDQEGYAVSVTTTLNSNYGSKVFVKEAGFFLNNEMDDFSIKPGLPNQYGLVGSEANAIEAEKRMLSSMTPTIVEKDGELYMVLGTPGGSTIITSVFQVFLNVAEFGMAMDEAVAAPRFHHQWFPDEVWHEPNAFSEELKKQLTGMGHNLVSKKRLALVKAIHVLPDGKLHGAGDPRNPDDAATGDGERETENGKR